jgi:predicted porin
MHFRNMHHLNKPLLATLVSAAFVAPASAQTNVNFEGLVDTYVGSMRYAGEPGNVTKVNGNGLTTSYFGFKGSENLGNGLKTIFSLTGYLRPDTGESGRFTGGDTLFSRDAYVGLSGNFGAVTLGRDLAPNFLPAITFNPFGNSFTFAPLMVHLHSNIGWRSSLAGDTCWSNQVRYTTPTIGGLTANVQYQFGEQAADKPGKHNVGGNLMYANGPLSLTAFWDRVQVNNPLDGTPGVVKTVAGRAASEQQAWMVGGAYDFQVVKLFATYDKMSHDVDFGDKTVSLGASVPVGSGKIMAAWAQTKRTGSGLADAKRTTSSVGYDYFLSKRTDLYTVVMNDKLTALESGTSFAAGIRHRF